MNPDKSERLIIENLKIQGYKKIVFEPDGNVTPDILIENEIAIEVRRLNQNYKTHNGFQGLEEKEYPLHRMIIDILKEVSDDNFESSAFVGYHFNRPLGNKKNLKRKIKEVLELHKNHFNQKKFYKISDNFSLNVIPIKGKLDQQFQYGLSSDDDSGGFIVELIYENLDLIIKEKERKIKEHKIKYPEWWLAVVDIIGFGLSDLDLKEFSKLPKIKSGFDRILLVSPLNPSNYVFLFEE